MRRITLLDFQHDDETHARAYLTPDLSDRITYCGEFIYDGVVTGITLVETAAGRQYFYRPEQLHVTTVYLRDVDIFGQLPDFDELLT